jgi:glutamine synthetase
LRAFAADDVVRGAFPADLVDLYTALKTDEWARFCGAVTDWEISYYSEFLP